MPKTIDDINQKKEQERIWLRSETIHQMNQKAQLECDGNRSKFYQEACDFYLEFYPYKDNFAKLKEILNKLF